MCSEGDLNELSANLLPKSLPSSRSRGIHCTFANVLKNQCFCPKFFLPSYRSPYYRFALGPFALLHVPIGFVCPILYIPL